MIDPATYPHLARIARAVVGQWPEHERFLGQSLGGRDAALMASSERHAEAILRIVGTEEGLQEHCRDYRFLCDRMIEEEMHFRRSGQYRLSRFEDALAEVYSNAVFMRRYMNYLLLSHVLWDNHVRAMAHFEDRYLAGLPAGTDHLEIGPGHGLLLHLACRAPAVASVAAWDVSRTSVELAEHCLEAMGDGGRVDLRVQNLFDAPAAATGARVFGSVTLSEVLEHLEDPVAALKAILPRMRPGALLWASVPINSPAPDHIYLLRSPEEAVELVRAGGFEPLEWEAYPMTGQTLERARRLERTISTVIVARRP